MELLTVTMGGFLVTLFVTAILISMVEYPDLYKALLYVLMLPVVLLYILFRYLRRIYS